MPDRPVQNDDVLLPRVMPGLWHEWLSTGEIKDHSWHKTEVIAHLLMSIKVRLTLGLPCG
jgi:hypothetical protein